MTALSSEALLALWESNHHVHPIERALALLDAAWPEVGAGHWARAPIGQRDCSLLGLQEALFGADLATTTRCPRCRERLESTFTTGDVRVRTPAAPVASPPRRLQEQDYEIDYRLPTSADLLEIVASGIDTEAATRELLRRCVLNARQAQEQIDPSTLPLPILARLGEQMTREDPEAEIRLRLTCPSCGHAWRASFDIASYLWSELEEWAHRMLVDIHLLAGAYGWSERQILALSPVRRRLYVDMVRA
jgi:hypothetical protein